MDVAYFSPMPPAKTGIAHYSAMLVPALREQVKVEVVDSPAAIVAQNAVRIYHLGNNPHHEWIYLEALKTPGIVVLHDVVLHHLIVEMTLARGDAEAYAQALRTNHGAAGEAWARGRAAGLHSEMGNFLFPASIELASRSLGVIVHNNWAKDLLLSFGVTTPIHVVPHPSVRSKVSGGRPSKKIAGVFGFLTSAKRGEVILEAAEKAGIEMLIVGEAAPNIDASRFKTTGYVSDKEFEQYYAQVDRLVNLRYPSAGETSGTLIRTFQIGKPIAVSDYAQFAEYPDDIVVKIPLGEGEVDALADFFRRDFDYDAVAAAQRAWVDANARLDQTVAGYVDALERRTPSSASRASSAATPLFPVLEVVAQDQGKLTLKNLGPPIKTHVYGDPSYRLIAKLFDGATEIADRWIELPRDLATGEETTVEIPHRAGATLRLYHALEGIPMLEPEAWHAAAL